MEAEPLLRIDDVIAEGISRAAREQNASLIVMGWGKRTGLRARLFGNILDSVLWSAHCPVAVTRLLDSPTNIQRILVPVENLTPQALSPLRFAQLLATANQAQVSLLHVSHRSSTSRMAWMRSQLSLLVEKFALPSQLDVQIKSHDNVSQAIQEAAKDYDLVVLRSVRRRTSTGGLIIGDVTTQLVTALTCSIVMLGEPQQTNTAVLPKSSQGRTTAVGLT